MSLRQVARTVAVSGIAAVCGVLFLLAPPTPVLPVPIWSMASPHCTPLAAAAPLPRHSLQRRSDDPGHRRWRHGNSALPPKRPSQRVPEPPQQHVPTELRVCASTQRCLRF